MKQSLLSAFAVLLIAASFAAAQTTAPAIPDAVKIRAMQTVDRDKLLRQLAGSPNLPDAKLADVVRLSIANNALHVHTHIPPTDRPQSRITVTDLPGICTLWARNVGGKIPDGEYAPNLFLFVRFQYDLPDITEKATTIEVLPNNLQLTQEFETLKVTTQIMLQQQYARAGDPPTLLLHVRLNDKETGDLIASADCTAGDMLELRRKFPTEFADYAEPMLAELSAADDLLPVDDIAARQVLGIQPSAELLATVKPLLTKLDADDPAVRDAAEKSLSDLGPPAILALLKLDREKLSPEQTTRLDKISRSARPLTADQIKPLADNLAFTADCLNDPDEVIAKAALDRLRKITVGKIEFDLSTRAVARRQAVDALYAHVSHRATGFSR